MDPDPGGTKTRGSGGFGSGSATLPYTLNLLQDVQECLCFHNSKFFFVFELEAEIYKTLVFRHFSAAATGSGSEQLTPITNIKFERSLTHPSMVKV